MPIAKGFITSGFSGALDGKLVFKRYGNKTVVTKFPDMTRIEATPKQKAQRALFVRAAAYAKIIINDPVQKKEYKERARRKKLSVYQFAIREFMKDKKLH